MNLKTCCNETSVRKTLFCPSMVMPCGTRNMFAPHDEMSLPVLASISSTARFGELRCCREVEPSAGSMENKHVAIHVDGDPGGFAKLNARRKTRPILYFFIPRNRRRSSGISTAAGQQCHDQYIARDHKIVAHLFDHTMRTGKTPAERRRLGRSMVFA